MTARLNCTWILCSIIVLGGQVGAPQDAALPTGDDVRSELLPLPCPPEALLKADDAKLRSAFFRMVVAGRNARHTCVGVVIRGQVLAPSSEFLKVLSHHAPVGGVCGCRPWESGVDVVILPEMSRRRDGTLAIGGLLGSADAACTYTAQPEGDGWRVDGMCQVM